MPSAPQLPLDLPPNLGWGGPRAGAGRKPAGDEPGISHRRTIEADARLPVLLTQRCRPHVWNLRSRRSHAVIAKALRGVLGRTGFRVVHFSIQGNHLHLVAEADSPEALANGMRSLLGRIAIGLNRMMGRRGPVFADRYHERVLRTPAEVRNAVAYVLGNFASHAARRGERVPAGWVDPYSSAAERGPDGLPPPVSAARSWLLVRGPSVARESAEDYAGGAPCGMTPPVPG